MRVAVVLFFSLVFCTAPITGLAQSPNASVGRDTAGGIPADAIATPQDLEKLRNRGYISTFFEILENLKARRVVGGRRGIEFVGPIGTVALDKRTALFCGELPACEWSISIGDTPRLYRADNAEDLQRVLSSSTRESVLSRIQVEGAGLKYEAALELLAGKSFKAFQKDERGVVDLKLSHAAEKVLLVDLYERYGLFYQAERLSNSMRF